MPNLSYCQLSINLPCHLEYEPEWPNRSQADRQNRWDMVKKLRDELDEHGDSENFELLNILRPEPEDSDIWWRAHNWGTKWSRELGGEYEPDLHLFQFTLETAWGPPLEICEYLTDELGFEVRCVWSSYENSNWGVWEYGDITYRDEVQMWHEDNFEELRELLEDCDDEDSKLEQMTTFSIFGGFESTRYISVHDREWIETEWQGVFEGQLDEYEEWLDLQPDSDREPLIKIKQRLLERTEELLEWGKITEGQYLKACDHLKKVTREEIEEFRDMFEPIADPYDDDNGLKMIDYYKKGGEEPNLIHCY